VGRWQEGLTFLSLWSKRLNSGISASESYAPVHGPAQPQTGLPPHCRILNLKDLNAFTIFL